MGGGGGGMGGVLTEEYKVPDRTVGLSECILSFKPFIE